MYFFFKIKSFGIFYHCDVIVDLKNKFYKIIYIYIYYFNIFSSEIYFKK